MTTYRTAQYTVTEIDEFLGRVTLERTNEKPAGEGGLVRRLYRNPNSKDKALAAGVVVEADYTKQNRLFTQRWPNASASLEDFVWVPGWKANGHRMDAGAWLLKDYLHPVEETNEFGIISP